MFDKTIYSDRRRRLTAQLDSGLILLLGNIDSPFNAVANSYRFRQDSSFLYFCGLDQPGLALVVDVDSGEEILFGDEPDMDDMIWSGPLPSLSERAQLSGIAQGQPFEQLEGKIREAQSAGRSVHFLPNCRAENRIRLAQLTATTEAALERGASLDLINAVVALRSVKGSEEVAELDAAADLGCQLHKAAMAMAAPGRYEWEIAGELEAVAARAGRMLAFPPIATVNGHVLHNHQRTNRLRQGDLLLVDAGVESALHYASDHTRTSPVGGRFDSRQREIYSLVLSAVDRARELIRPGVTYLSVHLDVCRVITQGLKDLGLMRGDVDAAVAAGAHALFMPHGLGHMFGLDVHDMEDLGEENVGYDDQTRRVQQFGTGNLRLGRELQEGFTLTVEPGIYFIPELIRRWRESGCWTDFVAFDKLESYCDFGGIRLEDDVLVTADGNRLLGDAIPLKIEDVESACH